MLTITHLLLTSVRRHRRELSVLRALGFTPRQARATVGWMAVTFAALALAAGVPLGIAAGGWPGRRAPASSASCR
jgi:ABC-type antimicrobial peptide transport system permease subunit